MLQFLPALMQGAQSVMGGSGQSGGNGLVGQFTQALGASGQPNQSNKNIGMQYANAGLQLPNTPSAQQMLGSLPQNMNQQQQRPLMTFNPLLQMLINGGR